MNFIILKIKNIIIKVPTNCIQFAIINNNNLVH